MNTENMIATGLVELAAIEAKIEMDDFDAGEKVGALITLNKLMEKFVGKDIWQAERAKFYEKRKRNRYSGDTGPR